MSADCDSPAFEHTLIRRIKVRARKCDTGFKRNKNLTDRYCLEPHTASMFPEQISCSDHKQFNASVAVLAKADRHSGGGDGCCAGRLCCPPRLRYRRLCPLNRPGAEECWQKRVHPGL